MSNGPTSVGIIMDGNRRWAKAQGRPAWEGHAAGKDTLLRAFDEYARIREQYGVTDYTFYAFSTENWKRSPEEVTKLIQIIEESFAQIQERLPTIQENGVRIRFIGTVERFPKSMKEKISFLEQETQHNTQGTIALALSYGGRDEIVRAVRTLLEKQTAPNMVTEEMFSQALDTSGMSEPDLIIRTGGAKRLSNFLTWQSAYSELMFTDTLWPDFTTEEFELLLEQFNERVRNFGA